MIYADCGVHEPCPERGTDETQIQNFTSILYDLFNLTQLQTIKEIYKKLKQNREKQNKHFNRNRTNFENSFT